MTVEAITGPLVVFQDGSAFPGAPSNANPDQGPSQFLCGTALLDPRYGYTYSPDRAATSPSVGFYATSGILVADYAPSAVATTNISASAVLSEYDAWRSSPQAVQVSRLGKAYPTLSLA